MMEYVCITEEKIGTSSREDVLTAVVKLWILARLKKEGCALTGFRIFLLTGKDPDNAQKATLENRKDPDFTIWKLENGELLILANQTGNIKIHKWYDLKDFHPAKAELVYAVIKKQMGKKTENTK